MSDLLFLLIVIAVAIFMLFLGDIEDEP